MTKSPWKNVPDVGINSGQLACQADTLPNKLLCPDYKKVKGLPRIIIWRNSVVLKYPMLHTKFQDHWLFGSREDFLRLLPYMGMSTILAMWPWPIEGTFIPQTHRASILNFASTGQVASEEKMFENVDIQRMPTYTTRWAKKWAKVKIINMPSFLVHMIWRICIPNMNKFWQMSLGLG